MKTLLTYTVSPDVEWRFERAQSQQESGVIPNWVDRWVDRSNVSAEDFSLSAARNRCIDRAVSGGYDMLILMDCDGVVERMALDETWPDFGTAVARDYGNPEYQPCSWLALRRNVFERYRYNEEFASIFWQDFDFYHITCSFIPKEALWQKFRCRHIPHPIATESPAIAQKFLADQDRYRERLSRLKSGAGL